MKTHKLIFLTTLLAISTVVSAQDYAFKVLANKGNNEVKSGESWLPLKTGASLKKGDEVKLGDNAYVGLVHSSGKPVEVKEAGVHKVSLLETKVAGGSSVLNKYTDFILSSSEQADKNRLSATGAVYREIKSGAPSIKLILPENENAGILNSMAIINWEGGNTEGPFVIVLKNMFEDTLSKHETTQLRFEIDLSGEKYADETAILVEVSAKADPNIVSKSHVIKKLTPAELNKVSADLKEIKAEVSDETALNKLILASFYERNNLLIDAIYAYEQAIKLEPEVPSYRESYQDFLVRHNLK